MSISLRTRDLIIHRNDITDLEEELHTLLRYQILEGGEACFVNGDMVHSSRKPYYPTDYQKRTGYDITDVVNSIMFYTQDLTEETISIVEVFADSVNIINIIICQWR